VFSFKTKEFKKDEWLITLSYEGDGLIGKYKNEVDDEEGDVPLLTLKVFESNTQRLKTKCYLRPTDDSKKLNSALPMVHEAIVNQKNRDKFFWERFMYLHIHQGKVKLDCPKGEPE